MPPVSSPLPFDPRSPGLAEAAPFSLRLRPPLAIDKASEKRRSRIWEVPATFHCSIVGTCLSAAELRQVFIRLGDGDARTASDHVLHGRAVRAAGQHELVGKMLHKALDKRHEVAVKRFSKATTPEEVRTLWLKALDQGEISGAYWAVFTHPATDRPLTQEVFGEVHMLSHLVGSANRLDLARLRRLEQALGEREEKIARQEARLQEGARERMGLQRRVVELEGEVGRHEVAGRMVADRSEGGALQARLDAERAHAAALAARLREAEERIGIAERRVADAEAQEALLRREVAALETALRLPDEEEGRARPASRDLWGVTLLYVGGLARLGDQLRTIVARRGGALLTHDGGVEDNPALLPGLISRADAAFFPVDCVSHTAAGQVKKHCRDAGKPFVPLRSASLASFIAALAANEFSARPQDAAAAS